MSGNKQEYPQAVLWKGLIRSFKTETGEFKVVKEAEGLAPWGDPIKAELHESEFEIDSSILVSLPKQDGRVLAILSAHDWEIWVTPKNEIHVVRPARKHPYPPDEYLCLTGK